MDLAPVLATSMLTSGAVRSITLRAGSGNADLVVHVLRRIVPVKDDLIAMSTGVTPH